MDDLLSLQGYRILRPINYNTKLAVLWKGFHKLVQELLLPLASPYVAVVHADIRPGFNVTANILCRDVSNEEVEMKLIDYESLVRFPDWKAPTNHRGYIGDNVEWNPRTFVRWQCISVAYAWLEERNVFQMHAEGTANMADISSLMTEAIPEWLPEPLRELASETKIDQASVLDTLDQLDGVFAKRDMLCAEGNDKTTILSELSKLANMDSNTNVDTSMDDDE
jgi:hypothetical protein